MSEQMRLDQLLVARGLVGGRDRAKELIEQGQVIAEGKMADKASRKYDPEAKLEILNDAAHYVSRAAHKLEGALKSFRIDLRDRVVLDVGASTGGFTQCALEQGAACVYAVDVGSGQLAEHLRADSRVVNLEKTDIRLLQREALEGLPDFVACDVSFISLRLVMPSIRQFLRTGGDGVILIKPQFEAGRSDVGRGGLVKDPKVHLRVLRETVDTFHMNGFAVRGLIVSPITGGDGNIEYLAWIGQGTGEDIPELENLVKNAHRGAREGSEPV